ncbi:MAG: nicotinamide mononucleotide transporter [Clostridia bacterium]|nr:nicotinamide mononucleotide transporter [Clostridia bacterium]
MKKPFRNGTFWLVFVTFVLITVTGIVFRQLWYRILPLYISLFVMLLQTRANRYAFLLGGLNSILYAIVSFSLSLYGSGIHTLLVSFPMQVLTFIRWNKKSYGNSTVLKRLTNLQRLYCLIGFGLLWTVQYFVLSSVGSGYILLDNTLTILGLAGTVFSLLRLIEYPFISIISSIINLVLYIAMLKEHPGQMTYVVYTVYSLICCVISLRFMTKLYKKQNSES